VRSVEEQSANRHIRAHASAVKCGREKPQQIAAEGFMGRRRLVAAITLAAAIGAFGSAAQAQGPSDLESWPAEDESLAMRDPLRAEGSIVTWSGVQIPALVEAMRAGGLVLLVRHGPAPGSARDPAPWRSSGDRGPAMAGEDEARLLGRGVQALAVPIGKVVASPFYRARDFAEIAFGTRAVVAAELRPQYPGHIEAYRRYLMTRPASGNLAVVGHLLTPTTARISQLKDLAEGHTAVYRPGSNGGKLIALIAPADWSRLAAAVPGG
jgi:phosphohistidine phosphatase SixA